MIEELRQCFGQGWRVIRCLAGPGRFKNADWPTFVRDGTVGNGGARTGSSRWRRLTEERSGSTDTGDGSVVTAAA
jgi:hypothetical protein